MEIKVKAGSGSPAPPLRIRSVGKKLVSIEDTLALEK
jgi:hypothetical protein